MPDLSIRSTAIEIMDDLNCSGKVVEQTLIELEIINDWLGGNAVTMNGLNKLLKAIPLPLPKPLTVADLGCGGGDMLKLLATIFRKKNTEALLTGIDANPNIIEYAQKNSSAYSEIRYQAINILSSEFKQQQYDIIFATLFFHHFTTDGLVTFFTQLKQQARIGIVINDLHRHWLAYYSIKILTTVFSKSSMVKNDAALSVHRGFRKQELVAILMKAGVSNYSLQWKWAFRWQLILYMTPAIP